MARNEEKARSMLNRYLNLKNGEAKSEEKRPYLSSECDSLVDAERWRRQILKEITKGITDIQNSSLGEFKIRDLNDHINKLVREKGHWERRILELGGPNYRAITPKIFDADGKEPLGTGTYRYYGEAKNLPGVAELFEKPDTKDLNEKKTRHDLLRVVDSDYYGYRDDEDGKLEEIEKEYEQRAIESNVEQWKKEQRDKLQIKSNRFGNRDPSKNIFNNKTVNNNEDEINVDMEDEPQEGEDEINIKNNNNNNNNSDIDIKFKSHVPLPSKDQIESILLEKRKEELRKRYAQE
ncbi:hypothetical protein DICPUDRAFT_52847 [Dictyostelium purpureum]|uniref:Pre-mRNA-splicing factor ISY1 n=1 Tax=Dictyostelium purpureum TaxID=5786 RepID=F0ZA89_DICPU|nr:uncharacterized protein DICPUDRAFT_52847 [Dictyostelium purpureum]EGC39161.1 hypothetical protein DICPUDRAFT_52847 [Dictyostelium purpureum]|eukprot:XP_003284307.1 hypothetical protein DICPUDRAFT_52847 [Dictyostelium purpureum]